jgi:plasmid maintenance system antidote protein VapI
MATKIKEKKTIGEQIKLMFSRNQSWLARQVGLSEAQLSRKINDTKEWTQEDLDKINKVLNTDFKL